MTTLLSALKYVPLSVLRAVAFGVATTAIKTPNLSLKRNIDINLRLAYPELSATERHELMQQVIVNQSLSGAESIKSWAMPPEWSLAQIHTVHNQQVFMQALANPKGMLVIVPHIGTWEMMNAWLSQFGNPTIMYKPIISQRTQKKSFIEQLVDTRLDDFILQGRQKLNATLVPTNGAGVKKIFKTLKNGGFSIILPDHVPKPSGGVVAPFFGINTLTSTLAPKLAIKTQCALVGLVCVRREDKQGFDIYCHAMSDDNLYHNDIAIATTALNKAVERMINPFCAHYTWGYKRFKKVPHIRNPYKADEAELQSFINTHVRTG